MSPPNVIAHHYEIIADRYEVIELLHHGPAANSYLAFDQDLATRVLIKRFHVRNERDHLQFEREAASVFAYLDHPRIIPVINMVNDLQGPCIVRQWIKGKPLETILADASNSVLSVSDALDVANAVSQALAHAHDLRVIHRDIKPRNVIIPANGEGLADAMLCDFALAGLLEMNTKGEPVTQEGEIFETVLYMAPEQITGASQSPRTDVFGLGLLLYRMLYGRSPFQTKSVSESLYRVMQALFEIPDRPDVPTEVREFLRLCLAQNPEDRFANGIELVFAIRAIHSVTG